MSSQSIERLHKLPFFNVQDYLALNPDLAAAGVDPAEHALNHGFSEGRPVFRRLALACAWGESSADAVRFRREPPARSSGLEGAVPPAHVSVLVSTGSSASDFAMGEALVDLLNASGLIASLADETSNPVRDHSFNVVVAPHVFFLHGLGVLWVARGAVERSVVLNTVSMHSSEFSRALPWILRARGLLECSPHLAQIFDTAGMPTLTMRLGLSVRTRWIEERDVDHPLIQALPRAARCPTFDTRAWDERPIDIAFFDENSPRRAALLRRHAPALARRPSFIYAVQGARDALDEEVERRAHFRLAGHVSAYARATLFLAEDEFPHFDWFRCAMLAMASGSVAITDQCPSHPDFVAGEHFFQDDERHVGELIRWLLDDEDGRAAARAARSRSFGLLGRAPDGFLPDLCAFITSAADPDLI